MPWSTARAMARSWSAAAPLVINPPTAPAPKPRTEISRPVRPSLRRSMSVLSLDTDFAHFIVHGDVAVVIGDRRHRTEGGLHALLPFRRVPGARRSLGLPEIDSAAAGLAVEIVFPQQPLGAERGIGGSGLAGGLDGRLARTLGHGDLNDRDEHAR